MFFLDQFLLIARETISLMGVLVIIAGALRSVYQILYQLTQRTFLPNVIRYEFGISVILGLEFMVGADIIGSLIQPDYYNLGMLAIIVLIRTVLSYFLNMELAALTPREKSTLK